MWLNKLLTNFAEMYREAAAAYVAGNMDAVPAAWKEAFDAASSKRNPVMLDLVLAMNAHINHDLSISVYRSGYARKHAHDFFYVEQGLSAGTDNIIKGLKDHYNVIAVSTADGVLGQLDEIVSAVAMRVARINAWEDAANLARADYVGGDTAVNAYKLKIKAQSTICGVALNRLFPDAVKARLRALEQSLDFEEIVRKVHITIDSSKVGQLAADAVRVAAAVNKMREETVRMAGEAVDATRETLNRGRELAGEALDDARETLSGHVDSAKETLSGWRDNVADRFSGI